MMRLFFNTYTLWFETVWLFLYVSDDLQDVQNIPDIGMSPMRGSGLDLTSPVSSVISRNKDSVDANASFCAPRQKVARELDVSVLNPRVCSQNSADNRETSEKRTLRISPAEREGGY